MTEMATTWRMRPRRSNLRDEVADHIRELVFSGQLRPGQRVDQDRLAEAAGVSKLPLREALIVLETEGIVESVPRRGVFVAALQPDDVLDHYRIYGSVLGIATSNAVQKFNTADLEELTDMQRRMEDTDSVAERERINYEFHRKINLAGASRRLLSAVALLSRTMPSHFYEFSGGWAEIAVAQHALILAAFKASDANAASEAMVHHIESGGQYAVERLKEMGFWDEAAT